jgi:group II intron reverse transcriptase/maturase/CRISPR-associated endonuclease Cas1
VVHSPPIERYLVRLRLAAPVRFHFLHGAVLRGLVSRALGEHELPEGVVPAAAESGRARFEAGEAYHLGLTFVGDDRAAAAPLLAGLQRVGRGGRGADAPPTLGGNFSVEAAEPLPAPDLDAEAAALAAAPEIALQLLSPLRLERPPDLKVRGAAYLNADCFPAGHLLDRLAARVRRLGGPATPPPLPAATAARPGPLPWIDMPVPGAPGKRRPYTLGGVLGRVRLDALPEDWLPWLVLGRHLHVGASTGFAFGRFRIEALEEAFPEPFRPARGVLERAAVYERLHEALDHVLERSDAAGEDGVEPDDFARGAERRLGELARDLAGGRYRPSALAGCVLRKDGGGVRALAIPTVRDRVAQRAVAQVLAPAVDTLLEDCSYAYRKGFSRAGAARALEIAYQDGYRYVLDADVESFFDAVDHRRLFAKLHALWPLDPVVPLLEDWVRAPVVFDGRRIDRDRGLPQGGAVSPLLANLFLDELDEEVLGAGFRLVRYADDFVVLAKDLDEAKRAREVVHEALAELGMRLHPEKTAVRSFDDGFSYLGYLFVRSLVLEQAKEDEAAGAPPPPLQRDDVPAASWLSQVPFARLRALVAGAPAAGRRRRPVQVVPLGEGDPVLAPATRPLYVSTPGVRLHLDGGSLVVESAERREGADAAEEKTDGGPPHRRRYPLEGLSHLTFVGHTRATVPLLLALARGGVPSFFCHRSGELYAQLGPHRAEWGLWLEQAKAAADDDLRLRFSREVVAAKLHNQARLVVRFDWQRRDEVATELRELEASAANQGTVESLLGLEDRGSALYFAALAASLPPEWGFRGRHRQPPPDPVNAMLSFGYTLLYNHVSTALTVAGLDPRIGLMHSGRGRHHALASDLVEEMRWLADALAWSLISRGRVKPEDFTASPDGRYPCWMTQGFRGRFLGYFEDRLHTGFTPPAAGGEGGGAADRAGGDGGGGAAPAELTTYRAFLADQARQVARLVRRELGTYRPLRLPA